MFVILTMDRRSSLAAKNGSGHGLDGAKNGSAHGLDGAPGGEIPEVKVRISRNGLKVDIPRVEGDADNVRDPWMRLTGEIARADLRNCL
jgi:hypothetical protein